MGKRQEAKNTGEKEAGSPAHDRPREGVDELVSRGESCVRQMAWRDRRTAVPAYRDALG